MTTLLFYYANGGKRRYITPYIRIDRETQIECRNSVGMYATTFAVVLVA
ncbi:MAG TPA: hypothetical protein VH107_17710 [Lacipirellulaceae bacterium]|nr:hypothetical protein [Lacipirellulaceae bacterium]